MPEEEIISQKEKTKTKIITLAAILGGIILIIILISLGKVAYRSWFKGEVIKPKEAEKPKEEIPEALPENKDFDSDGILNGWEIKYALNPKDPSDALDDPDKDDLTNLKEYIYGTDPKNPDTDGDGYLDGQEVKAGYNPKGAGKLKEPLPLSLRLKVLEGTWSGIITGAIYSSKDVAINLSSDGKINGDFIFVLEGKQVQNKISGQYDFNDKINAFSTEAIIKATLDKQTSQYSLNLYGLTNKEKSEIIGTFTLDPQRTYWLSKDRGTFKLTRKGVD